MSCVAGVIYGMDAVLQKLFVKVYDIAHLAVLQHKICVDLFLEELAILGDTLEFKDDSVINDDVKAQVVLQTLTLVNDRN